MIRINAGEVQIVKPLAALAPSRRNMVEAKEINMTLIFILSVYYKLYLILYCVLYINYINLI